MVQPRRNGRRTALVGFFAVLTIGATAAFFWKDLASSFYLRHLRADPAFLLQMIDCEEHTPQKDAVNRFVQTPQGKRAVFDALVHDLPQDFNFGNQAILGVCKPAQPPCLTPVAAELWFSVKLGSNYQLGTRACQSRLLRTSQFLHRIVGSQFTTPRYPDLVFRVLPVSEAIDASGLHIRPEDIPRLTPVAIHVHPQR